MVCNHDWTQIHFKMSSPHVLHMELGLASSPTDLSDWVLQWIRISIVIALEVLLIEAFGSNGTVDYRSC